MDTVQNYIHRADLHVTLRRGTSYRGFAALVLANNLTWVREVLALTGPDHPDVAIRALWAEIASRG